MIKCVEFSGPTPKCFNPEQYVQWRKYAGIYPLNQKVGPCEDCLPDYQFEMKCEGRCENRAIRFYKPADEDYRATYGGFFPSYRTDSGGFKIFDQEVTLADYIRMLQEAREQDEDELLAA